jgi:hypothetical protein
MSKLPNIHPGFGQHSRSREYVATLLVDVLRKTWAEVHGHSPQSKPKFRYIYTKQCRNLCEDSWTKTKDFYSSWQHEATLCTPTQTRRPKRDIIKERLIQGCQYLPKSTQKIWELIIYQKLDPKSINPDNKFLKRLKITFTKTHLFSGKVPIQGAERPLFVGKKHPQKKVKKVPDTENKIWEIY